MKVKRKGLYADDLILTGWSEVVMGTTSDEKITNVTTFPVKCPETNMYGCYK